MLVIMDLPLKKRHNKRLINAIEPLNCGKTFEGAEKVLPHVSTLIFKRVRLEHTFFFTLHWI